jgi:hypothetical protein
MAAVFCYGCGEAVQSTNRVNMLSECCSEAVDVWKKLVTDRLDELSMDEIDINWLINDPVSGFIGKLCRPCASALKRFRKLERDVRLTSMML